MPSYFGVTVTLLHGTFHGLGDFGLPEWPPSPMRLFQALVAAAARSGHGELEEGSKRALRWLENQREPVIVAPRAASETADGKPYGYRLAVPDNQMDVVARSWIRARDDDARAADPSSHRSLKGVRTTYCLGGADITYLWELHEPLSEEDRIQVETLGRLAHSIVALGWGIDTAVGRTAILSEEEAFAMPGEQWVPSNIPSEQGLRVPTPGALEEVIARHERFVGRLSRGAFDPPPALASRAFRKVSYRRSGDPRPREFAAFSLLDPRASRFCSFDPTRSSVALAGMCRHATRLAAERAGWSQGRIAATVLGHGEPAGESHRAPNSVRFAYVPLPSIEIRGPSATPVVGRIRRFLVTSYADSCVEEISWVRRALVGQELVQEGTGEVRAILSLLPASDSQVRRYTQASATWSTVTPVVLPGFDDPAHYRRRLKSCRSEGEQKKLLANLDKRIEALIRKALIHAGVARGLAERADIEWRKTGFWPGVDRADRYGVPDHLHRFPRYHVRIGWRDERLRPVKVAGPLCIGGGRFYGLGLFAPEGV